jgi:hypothetical protein
MDLKQLASAVGLLDPKKIPAPLLKEIQKGIVDGIGIETRDRKVMTLAKHIAVFGYLAIALGAGVIALGAGVKLWTVEERSFNLVWGVFSTSLVPLVGFVARRTWIAAKGGGKE